MISEQRMKSEGVRIVAEFLSDWDRSTEKPPAHQVTDVTADSLQCAQANQATNDPDVQQSS